MNILEKCGAIYARMDCGIRTCDNYAMDGLCRSGHGDSIQKLIIEVSEEVRSIIKERDELLAKLKEVETK